jgi:hypothetical protein
MLRRSQEKHTAERTCVAFHPALPELKGGFTLKIIYTWLIGGFNPLEKYESQIGSSSQLLGKKWENKTCSKPPTRWNCSTAMDMIAGR